MKIKQDRTYGIFRFPAAIGFMALLLLFLSSCSNTKHLGKSEYLYTGADIKIDSDQDIPQERELKSSLEDALYPEPNRKFLGLFRLRLWFYYLAGETKKEKGFKHWLKYKMGEPPVLLETVDQENVSKLIRANAFNHGQFKAVVSHQTNISHQKASVTYTVSVREPYRIGKVIWVEDTTYMQQKIVQTTDESLLQPGEVYSLNLIEQERERIRQAMLNRGFYYFSPSHMFFEADTTGAGKTVDLYLKIKEDIPDKATKPFRIKKIYIYPEYSLEDSLSTVSKDTLFLDDMHYISRLDRFRAEEITTIIFLRRDSLYSRKNHEKTISRLIGLNAFKYVNIRFDEAAITDSLGWLNMYVYLTPEKIHSVRAEIKGVAKSNNFVGPGLELSYINRNIFRGTEMLTVTAHGNWETQIRRGEDNLNSYEMGLNTRLEYPRLETPFHIAKNKQRYVPSTYIDLGYNFQHRVQYYTAHSLNTGFGYTWKNVSTSRNDLTVMSIEYYQLGNTTTLFEEKLAANPYLANTFKDQFMIGPRYVYTFNNQVLEHLKNHYYFQGRVDMSGLIVNGILQGIEQVRQTGQETDQLFGSRYAQYFKVDGDIRYYQNFKHDNKLVYRLFAGTGFPFGKSETLPYIKQYYAGGTNDIRAFKARELGPGSFRPPDTASVFFEQTGDIKLEANLEFRFGIQGALKGALFVDAGNIWLMNETPDLPDSRFSFNRFYKEIAVGTGFGLRFDLSFLILRTDLAFPLRKPWLPEGERWVVDEIYGYKGWGKENLILNIAIGYPF